MKQHKLIAARHEAGYSQTELANKVGIARPVYSYIENGMAMPMEDALMRICELLNKAPEELFEQEKGRAAVAAIPTTRSYAAETDALPDPKQN